MLQFLMSIGSPPLLVKGWVGATAPDSTEAPLPETAKQKHHTRGRRKKGTCTHPSAPQNVPPKKRRRKNLHRMNVNCHPARRCTCSWREMVGRGVARGGAAPPALPWHRAAGTTGNKQKDKT